MGVWFGHIGLIATVLTCTWHLSSRLTALETKVDIIKNNDLHSIEDRLGAIEKTLMDKRA